MTLAAAAAARASASPGAPPPTRQRRQSLARQSPRPRLRQIEADGAQTAREQIQRGVMDQLSAVRARGRSGDRHRAERSGVAVAAEKNPPIQNHAAADESADIKIQHIVARRRGEFAFGHASGRGVVHQQSRRFAAAQRRAQIDAPPSPRGVLRHFKILAPTAEAERRRHPDSGEAVEFAAQAAAKIGDALARPRQDSIRMRMVVFDLSRRQNLAFEIDEHRFAALAADFDSGSISAVAAQRERRRRLADSARRAARQSFAASRPRASGAQSPTPFAPTAPCAFRFRPRPRRDDGAQNRARGVRCIARRGFDCCLGRWRRRGGRKNVGARGWAEKTKNCV